MEVFKKAKSVRLRSYHEKYLIADSDQEDVIQDRYGTSKNAKWTVEFVQGYDNVIRLKSCYGKYLTATEDHLLLGVTGRKVQQILPRKLDSSTEWEIIIAGGNRVRLKTRYGNFLRANGGLPPLRNSITHDIPYRHTDWVLWKVDMIEQRPESPKKILKPEPVPEPKPKPQPLEEDDLSSCSSFHFLSPEFSSLAQSSTPVDSPRGRMVYYRVVEEDGNINDAIEESCFQFNGHGVEELTEKLEDETGLENITVCSRNPLNGRFNPLRLALPPNSSTMHILVLPSTSKVASDFTPHTHC